MALFVLGLSSCKSAGDESDDSPINTASQLTESDFEIENATRLSASEVKTSLDETGNFEGLNKEPDAPLNIYSGAALSSRFSRSFVDLGEFEDCVEREAYSVPFKKNEDGSFKAFLNDTEMTESCGVAFPGLSVIVSVMYDKVKAKDSQGDDVDIEGKTIDEVFDHPNGYYLVQLKTRLYMKVSVNGAPYGSFMFAINKASDFNAPCVVSDENRLSDCKIQRVDKSVYDEGESSENRTVLTIDDQGVTANPENEYFTNGSVAFDINGWTGTMTYDDDGSTPPRYTASKGSESISGTYKKISLFDERAAQILSSSLINLPASLLSEGDNESYMSMKGVDFTLDSYNRRSLNIDAGYIPSDLPYLYTYNSPDIDHGDFYEAARNYIGMASRARSKIQMFIENFLPDLHVLQDADLPVVLPESLAERFDLRTIVIKASQNSEYTWEIDLYYSADSSEPEVVFFLSLNHKGGKGRVFMQMENEEDQYAAAVGINGLSLVKKIEAVFDSSRNPATFEIKYIGDRSAARNYAIANWVNLESDASKDALIKVPEKVFLNFSYDQNNEELEFYGASYHPGWGLLEDLEGQAFWNDRSRTFYAFKGKSLDSDGAKLALALPSENSSDIADVWKNDSVEKVFADMVLSQLNSAVYKLNDNTNDYSPACADDPNWPITEICVEDDGTPPLYSGNVFSERYRAAIIYDCVMDEDTPCVFNDSDTLPQNPEAVITREKLEAFIYFPPVGAADFEKISDLYNQCRAISYMISPAFFSRNGGFAGTYDADGNTFYSYDYDYDGGSFDYGSSASSLSNALLNLSLNDVGGYSPLELKMADITRE